MKNWWMCLFAITLCWACSSDKKNPSSGAGTGGTGTAAVSGSSGSGGSSGSAGSAGAAGSAGSAGSTTAGSGGSSDQDGSLAADGGNDAGAADAGSDAGGGDTAFACKAPVPSATVGNTCPASAPVALKATQIGGNFEFPVFVTHSPNDPDKRLFVVERMGTIDVVKNNAVLPTPFIDINVVSSMNEQGLLGLAFDPDYETNGRVYVDYIGSDSLAGTKSNVDSYTVSANADVIDMTTKKNLFQIEDPEWNHNGGMLAFGPDNCLFISAGDGGGGDDQHTNNCAGGNGQCLKTDLGKLLRIDPAHPAQAAPGNMASTDSPHLWDVGLRNPWRFSFDSKTGDIYIGDVGQGKWEEVDVEPAGTGNKNYGWRFIEGKHCRGDAKNAAAPTMCAGQTYSSFVPPVQDYYHENGDNAVIGGYVYRGKNIPSLDGYYLYGDNGSNHIWAFVWDGTKTCAAPIDLTSQLTLNGNVSSFGEDVDGELYITTENDGAPGHLYRIDAK